MKLKVGDSLSDNYNSYDNNKNNINKKNNANRWVYTTNYDKRQFIFTMLLISFAVLIQFILLGKLSELIYNAWNSYFQYTFNPRSIFYKFFMSMDSDEFNNFISSISEIIVYIISFAVVFTVLIFFLRKAAAKTDMYVQNRVSFKFRLPKNTWALLILGLSIVYLCGMISNVLDYFFRFFGIDKIYYDTPLLPKTWYGFVLYFIAIVLTPAFFEEIFCRFLILNSLRKYGGGFAIITSAILFGMLHGRTDAFLYATAIGLYSAYIAVKTKSIWFSIILHAFVNAMTLVWGYISELKSLSSDHLDIIYLLFSCAIFIFSIVYLIITFIIKKKNLTLTKHINYVYIRRSRKILLFFNIATIIFLCLAIYQASQDYSISTGSSGSSGSSQSLSVIPEPMNQRYDINIWDMDRYGV
ncbi:MAG: CPBP family intramembrane metalloprotease [Oscillospiraceae bacterium]|nr:CPBP family intramembrane metalloprotease [Oscillospiraceae bacterium]